jgi:hypothetical protein
MGIDLCSIPPTVTTNVIDKSAEIGEISLLPPKLRKNIINKNNSCL